MLKKIVNDVLAKRHYWRDVTFDELSELYISMLFRSLALSVIGIFVPVFLLKNGYDIQSILLFFTYFFATRTVMDVVGGYLVARVGPKHTMVISYLSQIAASIMFLTLPDQNWPLLLPAIFWGAANSLFFVAFHVDFSKIKHSEHGGKELGYVNVMERIGATLGPITGGLLAYFLSPKYIFAGAIVLLLVGLVPLFKTTEPTRTKQHLDFKNFKIDHLKRDYISYAAVSMENNFCVILWPLFLALFALGSNVFLELGALASIGICASAVASYYIGKLVDEKKGGQLLNAAATTNALIYMVRPFVNSLPFALAVGVANDVVTVGYRIPYHKGMYDAADALPGYRIVYIVSMETIGSFTKFVAWTLLYLLSEVLSARSVITLGFFMAAMASLGVMTQKFKALEYAKH
jgi:MFS family permease